MVTTNTRNKWNIIEMETGPHTANNANCIVFVFDISSIWGGKKCNIEDETDKKTLKKTKTITTQTLFNTLSPLPSKARL